MGDDVRFSLRLPSALLERLRRVATQEERSVNAVMVRALRAYVEREEVVAREEARRKTKR